MVIKTIRMMILSQAKMNYYLPSLTFYNLAIRPLRRLLNLQRTLRLLQSISP